MEKFPFVDSAIAIIVIFSVLLGAKSGFIKSALGLCGIIISLLVAYLLADWFVNLLDNVFNIREMANVFVENFLINLNITSKVNGSSVNLFAVKLSGADMARETLFNGIEALRLPPVVAESINGVVANSLQERDYSQRLTAAGLLSPILSNTALKLLATILLFVIVKIVFGFLERRISRKRKTSKGDAVDGLLGIAVGLARAFLIVAICLTAITFIVPGENIVTQEIQKSIAGQFLYENNPLSVMLLRFSGAVAG